MTPLVYDAIRVKLGPRSLDIAERAALGRYEENRKHYQHDARVLEDPHKPDLDGAVGELALAAAMGLNWKGKFKPYKEWLFWRYQDGADIGDDLQVRATTWGNGRLLIQHGDFDDKPYILARIVSDDYSEVHAVGWVYGKEGKKDEYWEVGRHNRPCFCVPFSKLRPISTLPDLPAHVNLPALIAAATELD